MNKQDPAFWTRLVIVTVAPMVLVAAILFREYDLRARSTALDIVEFREVANAEAVKRWKDSYPAGSMIARYISPADSQRIRTMEAKHDSEYYRRWMAGKFAIGGTILLVVLCGLWAFIRKIDSASLQVT